MAPCAAGTWGDIPVEADTQFVDASYGGGGSDGSVSKPWTTIQDGIDSAPAGAIVAVAAGSYGENVELHKLIRLWGRCPELVEIVGSAVGLAGVTATSGGSGSEIRDLAVRSDTWDGVDLFSAKDVLLDRVWVHDTASYGLDIETNAAITVTRSLVEAANEVGVFVAGSAATFDAVVVRDTQPVVSDKRRGRGFGIQDDPAAARRANVALHACVVDRNREAGVFVAGADVTIEATVVRGTLPQAYDQQRGDGLHVIANMASGERAKLTLRTSVVDQNHEVGILVGGSEVSIESTVISNTQPRASDKTNGAGLEVDGVSTMGERATATVRWSVFEQNHAAGVVAIGSDATIEATLIRGTQAQVSDQGGGWGLDIQDDVATGERAVVTLRSSVVEQNESAGVRVLGSDAIVGGSAVRATSPRTLDQAFGRGIEIQDGWDTGHRGSATIRSSVVEDNRDVGVAVTGSDATIEATVLRGTQVNMADQAHGYGIGAQIDPDTGLRSTLVVRGCAVEGNAAAGIVAIGSDATVDATVVRDTKPGSQSGDGVDAWSSGAPASVAVTRSEIAGNAGAGIGAFGASATLGETTLACNGVDLDGEDYGGTSASWVDDGGNQCGCPDAHGTCVVDSTGLSPPEPVAPIE